MEAEYIRYCAFCKRTGRTPCSFAEFRAIHEE